MRPAEKKGTSGHDVKTRILPLAGLDAGAGRAIYVAASHGRNLATLLDFNMYYILEAPPEARGFLRFTLPARRVRILAPESKARYTYEHKQAASDHCKRDGRVFRRDEGSPGSPWQLSYELALDQRKKNCMSLCREQCRRSVVREDEHTPGKRGAFEREITRREGDTSERGPK